MITPSNFTAIALELAGRRSGVIGAEFAEATGKSAAWAAAYLYSLEKTGRIVRRDDERPITYITPERMSQPLTTSVAASTPLWRHDRPLRVVYRNGIKVTIGPSTDRDTRVQCGDADDVWGAGFRAAGIGRDVVTGKAWEDRK